MSESKKGNWAKSLSEAINFSTSIAASVGGCGFLGYYLDKKFATNPWLTLLGCVLGLSAAMKIMWDKMKSKK
ncbi:MAG: AtpZ/AtpI family protein [Syntrophomonadaceae bacterium]|jgi:F0F1-type ATP synthase assembly protein I|nr:AtpZ/AtpI family protein [Syntrophomonadaceae bacterium]